MTISAGSRLGPYEILAPLGAGGMGEVWRARDTRLERMVAIKALPAEFASDPRRRLQLEREAKAISALSHPNICTLYDIGHENGLDFLVMEYVSGETLANRIVRGALPTPLVLRHGMEIADALERAHKAGIVHRDLKPSNIMLTKSGAKVLDFGLARSGAAVRSDGDAPTRTLTEAGQVAGTLQYMAPEQLAGGEIDHRVDLFALGAVLYEMAAGRRLFETRPGEPPALSSPALDRIVRTCLASDPDERFQSAHDVKIALRWAAEAEAGDAPARPRRGLGWVVAALLAVTAALLAAALWRRAPAPVSPLRLSIVPPPGQQFEFTNGAGAPVPSPDGAAIVFTASKDGARKLWLRRLGSAAAEPLAGTEQAMSPFWSPDSRSIAFFANDKLMKLDIGGAAPVVICDAPLGRGGSWSADGTIIFSGRATPIYRVPAAGGAAPVAVTELDGSKGDTTHRWPLFLPGGRHFLYVAAPSGQALPTNAICAGSLDQKMRKVIVTSTSQPLFLDGSLLFVRENTLYAQRFDPERLALAGEPVALSERQIDIDGGFGRSIVSVSPAGVLVYQAALPQQNTQLIWYSRAGKQLGMVGEPASYGGLSLSRDARRLYFSYRPPSNIWSYDLEQGVKARVTFGNSRDSVPLVSSDGKSIVYASRSSPQQGSELRLRDLASGTETVLLRSDMIVTPNDWSPDSRTLLLTTNPTSTTASLTRVDLFWMSLDERKLHPYLQTPDIENAGRFSPDGKWVVYQSDQSGPVEVYLSPFPPTGARWQVSENGGFHGRWRADGKELYYRTQSGRLMAAPVSLGTTPLIGRATPLFSVHNIGAQPFGYASTPDGQRFLIGTRTDDSPPPPLTVVLHFDSELRAAHQR